MVEEKKWRCMFFDSSDSLGFDTWYAVVEPWLQAQERPQRVIELGSGKFSTGYFANHPKVEKVVSLETEPEWFEKVQKDVCDFPKSTLIQCFKDGKPAQQEGEHEEFLRAVKEHGPFDMALVDGTSKGRNECLDEILKNRLVRYSFFHDFMDAVGYGNNPHYYDMHGHSCLRVKWVYPTTAVFALPSDIGFVVDALLAGWRPVYDKMYEWLMAHQDVDFPTYQYFEAPIAAIKEMNPASSMYLWQEIQMTRFEEYRARQCERKGED